MSTGPVRGRSRRLPRILGAALLAAACSDSVSPRAPSERGGLDRPLFSFSPNGIGQSGTNNGSLNETGHFLAKGFDPKNPRHGDAVIATVFWLGQTNIVDSVVDFVASTPNTRVGNTYHAIDYVTAGGYSMATYVATNIQNFPDSSSVSGQILAVRAYMRDSVVDGGIKISAWRGVEDNFALALRDVAHASGTGTGASIPAHTRPIAVNAGGIVYTGTMGALDTTGAFTGLDAPGTPFGPMQCVGGAVCIRGSDRFILENAVTAVFASATTVDPIWNWVYDPPARPWLVTTLSLNAATSSSNQPPVAAFTSSCNALTCAFTSTSSDPDGSIASYSWTFGDGAISTVQNPSHTYATGGTYTVTLTVRDNLGATNAVSHPVTVAATNQAPVAAFTSSCNALACAFTSTSSDPDGSIASYSWTFGDGAVSTVQNPSHTYATAGTYTVTLTVTDNLGATNAVSHPATVAATNQAPIAAFTSSCNALTCAFTSTSSDADGSIASYSWTFGDGGTAAVQNPSHTYTTGGTYTVTLTVTDNLGATNAVSHPVTVAAANQSPVAAFTSTCIVLTCAFTSTSSDPDGSIASYSWTFGDGATSTVQNPSHTYATGGTYTVRLTVTDDRGATNAVSHPVTVSTGNQPPTAAFTTNCSDLTCTFNDASTDPDGSVVSWDWVSSDGAETTEQHPGAYTYAEPGTYTVTLTVADDQGAADTVVRTVTIGPANQPPTASFTFSCSTLTCSFTSTSSDPDGSIASYSWNFGDATSSTAQNPSHTYGAAGSYTVTLRVIDNQGAQSPTTSRTVTVAAANQAPTANFTFSCSALTCSFTSTSSDPDGSIASYSWNFGDATSSTAQNPSHTYGAAGSYTVTLRVTDNQGAQSPTTSQTVTVAAANQAPTASFTFSCSTLSCSFTSTSSDPDGTIASYSWNFGDATSSTAQNPSHTYGAAGSYTVTLRVTDNQGAQSPTTSRTVTVAAANQAPTASFTFSCSTLSCNFTSTSSDPDGTIASYSWNFGDATSSTAQNPSHTYGAAGSYTVTLRVTDNQGAQSPTTSRTVTVAAANQAPTANFTFSCSALTCSFTSTSSDPDGTISAYSWAFGDGATSTVQNPSHTYTAGGSYTVTLTVTDNQAATSAPTSRTVGVTPPNQPPTANFTFSCSTLTCTFTSTSSDPDGSIASYSWNFGDATSSTLQNPSHTYGAAGSYTVTLQVTDNQGAQSTTTSRTVTVTAPNQPPTANFTFSCSALACTFTSTSSDPDGSIASYSWNFGDATSSTLQNPSHSYGAAGSYTVTLRVTDNQGAQSPTTSRTVTVTAPNQPPTANFTFSCSALTCSFTSTSSDPDGSIASYSWNFGDATSSTLQNPSHSYGAAGSYTVTLRVTDNQGAQSTTTSKTVTVTAPNQPPTASFTRSCNGLSCAFNSSGSSDPDGTIASYSWTFGDGGTSTAANPSHAYAAGGTYTVTLRVTDNQGAQSPAASQNVTVTPPNQTPTASFTRSCNGLSCTFNSSGSSDPDGSIASYSWTFGDGGTSTAANPSHSYAAGGTYTVTLRVTDNQGAQSPAASQSVTVTQPNQAPTANFTFSCSGLSCSFTSTSSDPDGSIASYSWNFGDATTSTAQNPSHSYGAGGSYTVTLRVTDNQGAQSTTTSKTVTVTAPNSAPVVNAGPDDHALTGLLWSTSFSFSDANGNGPWSYTINWGDGSTSTGTRTTQGSFTVGHTYIIILPRSFTITVTVTDASGASGSDQKVVSVTLL